MDNRVKEMQEEKTQVEEKYRDIQCKFKNMKATHQEMQSKLYDIEKKKNEGLQVMFDEPLQRNTHVLKEKEEQEATNTELQCKLQEKYQAMQCKLQHMEKKNEGLSVMFYEALRRRDKIKLY